MEPPEFEVCSSPNSGHSARVRRATSEAASPTELGSSEVVLSPQERDLIAIAAGNVAEIDSPRPDIDRTGAIRLPDGPRHPQKQEGPSGGLGQPRAPEEAA